MEAGRRPIAISLLITHTATAHCGASVAGLLHLVSRSTFLSRCGPPYMPCMLAATHAVLCYAEQKVVDDLDDACAEIMLADDDEAVRMKVGECFWHEDKDAAEEQLEQQCEAAKQEHK